MKAFTLMTIILLATSTGCSRKSTSDQNFQDHQDRQPSSHYNPKTDPNINSLSNQPAVPKE